MTITLDKIIEAKKRLGYKIFEDDSKIYNLNLDGVRTLDNTVNKFNDFLFVSWKFNGEWNVRMFPCTTDPGLYWLEHPSAKLGTAIAKEGQYSGLWKLGLHQGKYKALVQKKPITVIRDFDRDKELDFDSGKTETGIFGINCHRANLNGQSINVDKWSAGCQVLQNREIWNPDNQKIKCFEFDYLMHLCDQAAENWGNNFTYTLLNEKDVMK